MPGKRISKATKATAAAMAGLGVPERTIARELGISNGSAHSAVVDTTLDPQVVEKCQERLSGRMAVASDSFLTHSLSRLKELGPYQAMLCSGIAHDKHVQGRMMRSRTGSGSVLVQVLIAIDQSARTSESDPQAVVMTSKQEHP